MTTQKISNIDAFKERAKARFLDRAILSIEVPQWEITVFFKTPNLETIKAAVAASQGDTFESQARLVVACAMDENGEKIWKNKAEYKDLMTSYDPGAVAAVAKAITDGMKLNLSVQEQTEDEKN